MWKWIKRRKLDVRDIAKADALAAKRHTITVPGKAGEVPGEYATLHHYLTNRYADIVLLTFDQIEGLLGCELPESARTQQEWWTGTDRDRDEPSCSDAWIVAGMTARPNLLAQTVVFECKSP
jgi:hypothetical protein